MSESLAPQSLELKAVLLLSLVEILTEDDRAERVLAELDPEAQRQARDIALVSQWMPSTTFHRVTESVVALYGFRYLREAARRSAAVGCVKFARKSIDAIRRLHGRQPEQVLQRIEQLAKANTRGSTWSVDVTSPGRAVLRNVIPTHATRPDAMRAVFEGTLLAILDVLDRRVIDVQSRWEDPKHQALTVECTWSPTHEAHA
ncbi:MAG: hypothetical protein Q8Q09_03150 [Deltaproteobacteria bacterium]|nr:hypothetical protein [Deltaproteobacteria bacterium]